MATAPRRGTLCSVSVSRVRRLAIIKGSAAFLAPLIGMVPFKRWPPTMRMRSITLLLPRAPAPFRLLLSWLVLRLAGHQRGILLRHSLYHAYILGGAPGEAGFALHGH